jgi:hypothetical protein
MNRYSDISVSDFNPLSMQEVFMTPMLKRKQHDESITKLEENALKLDPLKVHTGRAIALKNEMDKKIADQINQINKEGFNQNTHATVSKLNKEYQDLIGPMGEAGKINNAKIQLEAVKKRFMESDDAKGNSQEVNQANWEKHLAKYSGFDTDGKNIENIGDLSAVRYVDPVKYMDDLAVHAGFTDNSWKNSNSGLVDTGIPGENRYVVNTMEAGKSNTNIKNLQNLASMLNKEVSDSSSPLRKSIDYTMRDPKNVIDQWNSQLGIYTKQETNDESGYDINNVSFGEQLQEAPAGDISGIPDPDGTKTLGENPEEYDFSQIGKPYGFNSTGSSPSAAGSGAGSYKYKDIVKEPLDQKRYEKYYSNTLGIDKTKGLNDPKNAQIIFNKMKEQGPITLQSRIIRPDIEENGNMFMGKKLMGATGGKGRNILINQDVAIGTRQVLDPTDKNGTRVIPKNEFGTGEGQYNLSYVGYDSPYNKQQTMAHKAILYQKVKGQWKNVGVVPVSRTDDEMKEPSFKVANRIMLTYRNAALTPNEFTDFSTSDSQYKGLQVKYQTKDKNGLELEEPIMTVKTPDGQPHDYNLKEFAKYTEYLMSKK